MKLGKRLLTSLLTMGLIAAMAGNAQAASMRFATENPRADALYLGAEKFGELLKAKTGGELEIKIFSNGALGTFSSAVAGVRSGTVEFIVSDSASYTTLNPLLGLFDIPFLFKDSAHAFRVLDGKIGKELLDSLGSSGLKGLAYWDYGWRQMSNDRRPIRKPDDLRGLKMRTSTSLGHTEAFRLFGATPVPMPLSELYRAMETKAVDAQEQPLGSFWSTRMYEAQRYLSLTNHAYSPALLAMNKAKFDALSSSQQKAVLEAAREAGDYLRKLNAANTKKIIDDVKRDGVLVIEKLDIKPFIEASKPVRQTFVTKFGGEKHLKEIDTLRDAK